MQPFFDAIFYDLDGTLVDSCAGIEWAARQAISRRWPNRQMTSLRHLIGPPIRIILQAALREQWKMEIDEAQLDELESHYRALYDDEGCRRAAPFPGVRHALQRRHDAGLRQFIVTNKPALPTRQMLQTLDLQSFIEQAVSPDSRRPRFCNKGEAALELLAQQELNAHRVLLLGDARDDALAAQYAEIHFVAASWGYGAADTITDLPSLAAIDSFDELDDVLSGHQSTLR